MKKNFQINIKAIAFNIVRVFYLFSRSFKKQKKRIEIKIDQKQKNERVNEITSSDYFETLKQKAKKFRKFQNQDILSENSDKITKNIKFNDNINDRIAARCLIPFLFKLGTDGKCGKCGKCGEKQTNHSQQTISLFVALFFRNGITNRFETINQKFKQENRKLLIQIDPNQKHSEVAEITSSDYFETLKQKIIKDDRY